MKRKLFCLGISLFFLAGLTFPQTWTATKRLTYNSGYSRNIKVAIDSNNLLHVVWSDNTPGNFEVFYKKATNGGSGTWSALKRLTYTSGNSDHPSIAIDTSNVIHVVWEDDSSGNYELYHKQSADHGVTWSSPTRITWSSGSSRYPHISVSPSNNFVRLFYTDNSSGDYEIYYKKRILSWSTSTRLTYSPGDADYPWGGVDTNGDIHAVWQDDSAGNNELYHKRTTDGGTSWSAIKRITYNSGNSSFPSFIFVTAQGSSISHLRLIWQDDTPTPGYTEVYYKVRSGVSENWLPGNTRLTWNTRASGQGTIAADSNSNIHIIYMDHSPSQFDLYHKKTTDDGATWSAVTRVTWSPGDTFFPEMVIGPTNNHLHLVFFEQTGTNECYFKLGTQ